MAGETKASLKAERKRRSRLFWPLMFLAVLALYLLSNFVDVWWTSRLDYTERADAAIVLGAAQYNGEPSPALQGRLDHAIELYQAGQVKLIVLTGGGREGDATTEAKASYDYLRTTAGIPDEDLKLEVDGTSTYESLAAAALFLSREGITDVVIVTDPYHARRASLVAGEVGLEAHASPTEGAAPLDRLAKESVAVSVGRLISFRRLERLV